MHAKGRVAYQVLTLALRYAVKMEHQELETVAMTLRHSRESLAKVVASLTLVHNS